MTNFTKDQQSKQNYPLLCPFCQSTLHNSKALSEHIEALH